MLGVEGSTQPIGGESILDERIAARRERAAECCFGCRIVLLHDL